MSCSSLLLIYSLISFIKTSSSELLLSLASALYLPLFFSSDRWSYRLFYGGGEEHWLLCVIFENPPFFISKLFLSLYYRDCLCRLFLCYFSFSDSLYLFILCRSFEDSNESEMRGFRALFFIFCHYCFPFDIERRGFQTPVRGGVGDVD